MTGKAPTGLVTVCELCLCSIAVILYNETRDTLVLVRQFRPGSTPCMYVCMYVCNNGKV